LNLRPKETAGKNREARRSIGGEELVLRFIACPAARRRTA